MGFLTVFRELDSTIRTMTPVILDWSFTVGAAAAGSLD